MALSWLAEQMICNGITTRLLQLGPERLPLPEDTMLLFPGRVRELLMNVVKHASVKEPSYRATGGRMPAYHRGGSWTGLPNRFILLFAKAGESGIRIVQHSAACLPSAGASRCIPSRVRERSDLDRTAHASIGTG